MRGLEFLAAVVLTAGIEGCAEPVAPNYAPNNAYVPSYGFGPWLPFYYCCGSPVVVQPVHVHHHHHHGHFHGSGGHGSGGHGGGGHHH